MIILANAPLEVAVGVYGQATAQLGTPSMELAEAMMDMLNVLLTISNEDNNNHNNNSSNNEGATGANKL